MHKLVILIHLPPDDASFDDGWPEFLQHAEQMPGLLKEATGRVTHSLYGETDCSLIHELYFESPANLEYAMQSEHGRKAGEVLQRIARGRLSLFFSDHHEDTAANLQRGRTPQT